MNIKLGPRFGTPRHWVRRCNVRKGNARYSLVISMNSKIETVSHVVDDVTYTAKVTRERKASVHALPEFVAEVNQPEDEVKAAVAEVPIFETSDIRLGGAPLRPTCEALFGEADEAGQFLHQPLPDWLKGSDNE